MFDALDACAELFLRGIDEPHESSLRVRVEEARPSAEAEDLEIAGHIVSGTHQVVPSAGCRTFELEWASYVAFAVRNESFTTWDASEVWQGRRLRRYTVSKALDFVRVSRFADDQYPGPLCHWGLVCAWHIIDVVSTAPPVVRLVGVR